MDDRVLKNITSGTKTSRRFLNAAKTAKLKYVDRTHLQKLSIQLFNVAVCHINIEDLTVYAEHGLPDSIVTALQKADEKMPDLLNKSWRYYAQHLLHDLWLLLQYRNGMENNNMVSKQR